jgi:AP-1-like factor
MTMELNEYKKKLTLVNNPRAVSASRGAVFGDGLVSNLNDVNFQFEFPKFGVLPGPTNAGNGVTRSPSFPSPSSSFSSHRQSTSPDTSKDQATPGSAKSPQNSAANSREALSKFSSIIAESPYDTSSFDALLGNASRTSLDSANFSVGGGTNSGSPSASSNSNAGPSSSCGTSPEPYTQSPLGFKPVDTLTTIGEEQPSFTADNNKRKFIFGSSALPCTHIFTELNFGNFDVNNFDWLAQQNGGQFDPQLFGDYRAPQDSILANTTFDDTFFNEAFDADFATPFNMAPSPNLPKKDICAELDARKENEDTIITTVNGKLLTCNNIWYVIMNRFLSRQNLTCNRERLQTCPKVQAGDIDLDGLCSDLQKKAKCGGSGAVVDEKDFKAVMSKHLGAGACPDSQ